MDKMQVRFFWALLVITGNVSLIFNSSQAIPLPLDPACDRAFNLLKDSLVCGLAAPDYRQNFIGQRDTSILGVDAAGKEHPIALPSWNIMQPLKRKCL